MPMSFIYIAESERNITHMLQNAFGSGAEKLVVERDGGGTHVKYPS
jgi:hypothetical protein